MCQGALLNSLWKELDIQKRVQNICSTLLRIIKRSGLKLWKPENILGLFPGNVSDKLDKHSQRSTPVLFRCVLFTPGWKLRARLQSACRQVFQAPLHIVLVQRELPLPEGDFDRLSLSLQTVCRRSPCCCLDLVCAKRKFTETPIDFYRCSQKHVSELFL